MVGGLFPLMLVSVDFDSVRLQAEGLEWGGSAEINRPYLCLIQWGRSRPLPIIPDIAQVSRADPDLLSPAPPV